MTLRRPAALAVANVVLAAVVAFPSLFYPFGRDQGLYAYVGREWLLRGALPYRDLFEQKTPGIFAVHAACVALFGDRIWGIRVVEIAVVALIGVLAGSVDDARPARAESVLGASILYFGFCSYWDTAQCELWCALFITASLFMVERGAWMQHRIRTGAAPLAAGLFFGLALVMKPPVLVFGIVLAWRARRRGWTWKQFAASAAAAALPWTATLAYFGARGGIRDLVDVLVGVNRYYALHENIGGVTDATTRTFDVFRHFAPVSFFLLYAVSLFAWKNRSDPPRADPYRLVLACAAAAFAAVAVQWKFFPYHFGVAMVPAPLAVAALAGQARAHFGRGRAVVLAHAIGLFVLSWPFEHEWLATALDLVRWRTGTAPRSRFDAHFDIPFMGYSPADSAATTAWLIEHAKPGDTLCVRGFEAQIYAGTGMRCPSRFFWTSWLAEPQRAYRREDFVAQDRSALLREPPRFVVVRRDATPEAVDGERYIANMGYARVETIGMFAVLERMGQGRGP